MFEHRGVVLTVTDEFSHSILNLTQFFKSVQGKHVIFNRVAAQPCKSNGSQVSFVQLGMYLFFFD